MDYAVQLHAQWHTTLYIRLSRRLYCDTEIQYDSHVLNAATRQIITHCLFDMNVRYPNLTCRVLDKSDNRQWLIKDSKVEKRIFRRMWSIWRSTVLEQPFLWNGERLDWTSDRTSTRHVLSSIAEKQTGLLRHLIMKNSLEFERSFAL